ncbi:hypothetical protein [Actinomadura luteofluorescens]|uniref:hypothetical protein n=1 Tax=Actinomadura luteofluorescens TaxID=46163 RepID=UPI003D8A1062
MTLPASVTTQIYARLYELNMRLESYAHVEVVMKDNRLLVKHKITSRQETITCAPRPSDGDRLWFWTSERKPITEAEPDRVVDAAMAIAGALMKQ